MMGNSPMKPGRGTSRVENGIKSASPAMSDEARSDVEARRDRGSAIPSRGGRIGRARQNDWRINQWQ